MRVSSRQWKQQGCFGNFWQLPNTWEDGCDNGYLGREQSMQLLPEGRILFARRIMKLMDTHAPTHTHIHFTKPVYSNIYFVCRISPLCASLFPTSLSSCFHFLSPLHTFISCSPSTNHFICSFLFSLLPLPNILPNYNQCVNVEMDRDKNKSKLFLRKEETEYQFI